ncbi:spore gernimation protein [Paenibacillus sp. CAA11]|uniref:GerAB/ArcD/ProY family transporter n=1 Tax=Paenibacillus sp. CAA11 TaxID=1532905 RepID=UPI000D3C130D|nr:endospore germination permease [Paenibacillus sp. CAA11]AWB43025.1 spore gernimation protein [Paenibacillus sp. CAA11]
MNKGNTRLSEVVITLSLFEVGSTTLFQIGAEAKQDAWLAVAIGAGLGLILLLMYLLIQHLDNQRDLYEMCLNYFGKWLGRFIGLLFIGYFLYEASRNLRDLGELTVLTLLNRTPLAFILVIAIAVVTNTIRYGPRMLMLVCTSLLPIMVLGYGVIVFFVLARGMADWELMKPVLDNGWSPVLKAAIPEIVSFPFGQLVLFLVFFKLVTPHPKLNRSVLTAYVSIALILMILNQINILVLGPAIAADLTYPLLEVVQLIQIAKVFERTDALFTLILFLGLGIKIAAFFSGAVVGFQRITGINYKKWAVPAGLVILALSFLSNNYTEYLWVGLHITVSWTSPIFQMVLPLLLLVVMLLRKKKRPSQKKNDSASPS